MNQGPIKTAHQSYGGLFECPIGLRSLYFCLALSAHSFEMCARRSQDCRFSGPMSKIQLFKVLADRSTSFKDENSGSLTRNLIATAWRAAILFQYLHAVVPDWNFPNAKGTGSVTSRSMTTQNKMRRAFAFRLLLMVQSLFGATLVHASTQEQNIPLQSFGNEGREIIASPSSADCMTDNGPTQCNEPIWIHGSPGDLVHSNSSN